MKINFWNAQVIFGNDRFQTYMFRFGLATANRRTACSNDSVDNCVYNTSSLEKTVFLLSVFFLCCLTP